MNRDDFYAFLRQALPAGPASVLATEPQLYERLTQHPRPPVFGAPQGPVKPWESSEAWRETFETLFVSEPPSVPAAAGLYAILNLKESFDESMLMQHVEALIWGGVAVVQLRAKDATEAAIKRAGRCVGTLLAERSVPLVINDRPGLAAELGAFGVHVGQTDLSPTRIASTWPELTVGLSTHNPEQAAAAQENPNVGWVALGPIFESPTKQNHAPVVGLAHLRQIRKTVQKPLIAIGGLTSMCAAFEVGKNGADYGAAVSVLANLSTARENAACMGFALWLGQRLREAP